MPESGRIVTSVGATFEILLESLGAAGYQWTPQFDARHLRLRKADYRLPEAGAGSKSQAVGGAGVTVLVFEALATGETSIRLANKREWESTPIEERTIAVSVR